MYTECAKDAGLTIGGALKDVGKDLGSELDGLNVNLSSFEMLAHRLNQADLERVSLARKNADHVLDSREYINGAWGQCWRTARRHLLRFGTARENKGVAASRWGRWEAIRPDRGLYTRFFGQGGQASETEFLSACPVRGPRLIANMLFE